MGINRHEDAQHQGYPLSGDTKCLGTLDSFGQLVPKIRENYHRPDHVHRDKLEDRHETMNIVWVAHDDLAMALGGELNGATIFIMEPICIASSSMHCITMLTGYRKFYRVEGVSQFQVNSMRIVISHIITSDNWG